MPHHVMLVDDDKHLLEGLRRSLRKEKYQLHCAQSAQDALEIMQQEPVDLVVTDYDMPGICGTELLAMLRRSHPDTVRMILTGKATLDMAIEAINQGAVSRFFVKPCNIVDLSTSIRQALQQKDLHVLARKLVRTVERQSSILEHLEEESPGITSVQRDGKGTIVIDDLPSDHESLVSKIEETLARCR